jgi:hypothetical protein
MHGDMNNPDELLNQSYLYIKIKGIYFLEDIYFVSRLIPNFLNKFLYFSMHIKLFIFKQFDKKAVGTYVFTKYGVK